MVVFGFSQVPIDLEPTVGLARGAAVLHRCSHRYVGATFLAVVTIVVGRPVCERIARRMNRTGTSRRSAPCRAGALRSLGGGARRLRRTYGHVLLDGVMHLDGHALAPFSPRQPLLALASVRTLHLCCVPCGVAGGLALRDRLRYRSLPDRCG